MTPQTILLISSRGETVNLLERTLSDAAELTVFTHLHEAFDHIYDQLPDLLIYDLCGPETSLDLLNDLKDDPFFVHLPVCIILNSGQAAPDWQATAVEDYIRYEDLGKDIVNKTNLCISRSKRIVEINPLTRLPGNISINRQIQNRIDSGTAFSLAYVDLDHFKPFNDKYGFSRGDDVLKITGRLLFSLVTNRSTKDVFVGHIGGDDFIFLMAPDLIEKACRDFIDTFDRIVPSFYDPDDRSAGYIQSLSREGKVQKFPIMSLSIGIVIAPGGAFAHFGEVTSLASEMKSVAKKQQNSSFQINRRSIR